MLARLAVTGILESGGSRGSPGPRLWESGSTETGFSEHLSCKVKCFPALDNVTGILILVQSARKHMQSLESSPVCGVQAGQGCSRACLLLQPSVLTGNSLSTPLGPS